MEEYARSTEITKGTQPHISRRRLIAYYAERLCRNLNINLNEVLDMHPQEYPTLLARATFWRRIFEK